MLERFKVRLAGVWLLCAASAWAEESAEPIEVTVEGTALARLPGSAHVVKKSQLERLEYDDPHAALTQVPGVYIRQEDGVGLRPNIGIRGGNPDRSKKLTLMEDGVLFAPAPYSAPAAYYFPLLTRMSAIKVTKGPSAIAYGPQSVGGAIDFITSPIPSRPQAALDVALGEYGYGKGHARFGASSEQFGFLMEGVHLHNEGFKELRPGADTGSTRNDWLTKAFYLLDPTARVTNEFRIKLGYSDEVSNESYLGLTDADFRDNPNRRYLASGLDQMRNHRSSLVLSHQVEDPEAQLKLETHAYRHDYARTWRKLNRFLGSPIADVLRDPTTPTNAEYYAVLSGEEDAVTSGQTLLIGPNQRRFVSQGVSSKLSLGVDHGSLMQRIELGARLHHDSIERRHSESGYLMRDGELIPDGQPTLVTTANRAASNALALYAMDAVTYGELTVTPGLRVELIRSTLSNRLNGERGEDTTLALLPGIGGFLGLAKDFGILAGVHRGFSPPPPASHESPEYSVNYEAGARFTPGRSRFELIGFFNDYSNLTNICTFSSGCADDQLDSQVSAGRAEIHGFEAYADTSASWGDVSLPLGASYTYTRGAFQNAFSSSDPIYGDVGAGDQLPYLPRHQASASLGLEWSHAAAVVAANYVAPMREEASSEPLSEAWVTDQLFTLDVGSKIMPWRFLTLYGNVRNLLGSQKVVSRRPFGARPNAPRWVQIGCKLAW